MVFGQGALAPPAGPPCSQMKTLAQVEPRIPIATVPFTIDQPGSYYLTGELELRTSGVDAITIAAGG